MMGFKNSTRNNRTSYGVLAMLLNEMKKAKINTEFYCCMERSQYDVHSIGLKSAKPRLKRFSQKGGGFSSAPKSCGQASAVDDHGS